MLTQEDYWMIQDRLKQGVYQKDIAAELGVHPKTVRRAMARGGAPSPTRRRQRHKKLAPYVEQDNVNFVSHFQEAVVSVWLN